MNRFKSVTCGLAILPAVLTSLCSLPADVKPVRWRMNLQVPVTDQRFYARDLLEEDLVPELTLQYDRDTTSRDTVAIEKSDSLEYVFEKKLIATDTSTEEKTFGAQALDNTPFVDVSFSLTENTVIADPSIPLPVPVHISNSKDNSLGGIQSVTIDTASPDLMIDVANRSQQIDIEDIDVVLIDKGDTLGKIHSDGIAAQSSVTAPLSLGGKTIHDPITVAINAVLPAGSTLHNGDGLNVSFSLDGQMIEAAVIADSMIHYSDVVTGSFTVADSIDLAIIDLDDALLGCEVTNPSALMVGMKGVIDNAWDYDFAVNRNLNSLADLADETDSSGFAGSIINDTIFKNAATSTENILMPLKNMRLFPTWDATLGSSVLTYQYTVQSLSDGRLIHFNKNDKFVFKLVPSRFPFIRIKGRFTAPIEQTFSSQQPIGFGWNEAIIDSLKKSFRFQSTPIRFTMIADIPDSSSMDSLQMHITVDESKQHDSVVIDETLTDIARGNAYTITADLSDILNTWPDSIGFNARMLLLPGTDIDIYNQRNPDGSYKSTLSIGVAVNYTVSIPFCWKVLDTIRTELEQSSFSPDLDGLEWINTIENPSVRLELDAVNTTNLNLQLYAIGAGEPYKTELDNFPSSLIGSRNIQTGLGKHLFSLTDEDGISLAGHGSPSTATIQLDKRGIDALLSKKKCLIRWFLIIPATDYDAFTNNAFIDLKATAIVEGIGDTDSLLYEDR
jgi:hypothetical protein